MLKKPIYLTISIVVISIIVAAYFFNFKSQSSSGVNSNIKNIEYKTLVDKFDDNKLIATFYYDALSVNGLDTDTYIWQEKKFMKSENIYRPTYANKYSTKSIDNLQVRLKLSKSPIDEFGQLYFYGNASDYELFIFDCSRTGKSQWKVFFLSDSSVKEVNIKKDIDEVRLDSYQISRDAVYLYTRSKNDNNSDIVIYKINISNYNSSKIVVPLSNFKINKVIVQLDKIFIRNNELILATSNFNNIFDGQGVILKYNFASKTAKTIFVDHTIHKVFPYNNQYLVLSNDKNSYKPCIKFYDNDFKLMKSNNIDIDSEYGDLVIGARDYFYYLRDDKLYGSLSINGIGNIDYLIVLDVKSSNILYLAEIIHKKNGYVLQDVRFHLNEKGKYVDISSF